MFGTELQFKMQSYKERPWTERGIPSKGAFCQCIKKIQELAKNIGNQLLSPYFGTQELVDSNQRTVNIT